MARNRVAWYPRPFALGLETAGIGWILAAWLIPNSLIAAVLTVLGMVVAPHWGAAERAHWHVGAGMETMEMMVGGTLGGFLGDLTAAVMGLPGTATAMALMTASMVGMVGGVLGGGLFRGV